MNDAIKKPYGNTHIAEEIAFNTNKIEMSFPFVNSSFPRLFLVECAMWNANSIQCAIGFVRMTSSSEADAIILHDSGIVDSVSVDATTRVFTVNLIYNRSYCKLVVFDC